MRRSSLDPSRLTDIHYLQQQYERWQTIYELAPVGISVADSSGQIIAANPAAERILKQPTSAHVGRDIDDARWQILAEDGSPMPSERFASTRALREQCIVEGQVMQVVTADEVTWLTVSAAPLPQGGVIVVYADITDIKQHQRRIEQLSAYDQLTQLANRTTFFAMLDKVMVEMQASAKQLAVAVFDIDSFKEINETAGHEVGDRILCEVAQRLQDHAPAGSFVARIGGDEFAVLCEHGEAIQQRATQYLAALSQPLSVGQAEFRINLRAGLSLMTPNSSRSEALWRQADLALHEAKARQQQLVIYQQAMSERFNRRFELTKRLQEALLNERLHLYFQPQFAVSGAFTGTEVLARWNDAHFGDVSPAEFIPLAEERGLICQITETIFTQLLATMQVWQRQGLLGQQTYAVNISIRDLERPDFAQQLVEKIQTAGFTPTQFELEITETALMKDPQHAFVTLRELQECGFTIAIDDFGIGHSSLSYIKQMHAQRLKIDMSFTQEMLSNPADYGIVKTIIAMADIFAMKTLAEGVETEQQAEELKRLGCDYVQGYLLAKPMPAEDYQAFLHRQQR
ncbi:phosphodiesterase [Pseudidiomarina sediminum]|uniref:Phosphodiesterase n=1 Tax=Pseudidiomarina sediminum TaxID=431675 RepID=A0A432Z2D7_9GAMM|nr:GGDEF domain-containing phosphodiesterase [Pseudidiomarina sediminum]RUO72050.1 phosphodiesterase [Pseudidiomarina sediminum]